MAWPDVHSGSLPSCAAPALAHESSGVLTARSHHPRASLHWTPAVGAGVGRLSNPNARRGVKGRATTSDGQALNSLVLRAASKLARVKRVSWLCAMPFCLRSPNPKMGAREKSTLDPTRGGCRVGEWRICAGAFSGESIARQAPQHGENTGLETAREGPTHTTSQCAVKP